MLLETVRMKRGRNDLVIQGMQHVAPAGFYKAIQAEIMAAAASGHRVYYEGLRNNEALDCLNEDERQISGFFRSLFATYDEVAAACGFVTQKESLYYPPDAVNADMSLRRLVVALGRPGPRSRAILWLLRKFYTEEMRQGLLLNIRSNPPREALLNGGRFHNFLALAVMWPFWPVLVDFPNFLVVDAVERALEAGIADRAYVCYGQAHLPGIIGLFEERGWQVLDAGRRTAAMFLDAP